MVIKVPTVAMSLTNNGLRDWLIQRISAVIIAFYYVFLMGFFFLHPDVDFSTLQLFFSNSWMKVFTLLTLLSLFLHAWIGIWTVLTDYVKPASVRFFVEAFILILLVIYFLWGLEILWR